MKYSVLLFFFMAFATVLTGGCVQTFPENATGPATLTLMNTVTTVSSSPVQIAQTPPLTPPADPLIGIWRGYNNLPTGRIERVWVFNGNGTWIMTNTNVRSQKQKVIAGAWRKGEAGTYQILPPDGAPDTFTYDKENDRLSDSYFRETYSRITHLGGEERLPTMNITVHSVQRVSSIGGSHPIPGNLYLVVNITVENINETGWYVFSDENIRVVPDGGSGSQSLNCKSGDFLENMIPPGRIMVGEKRQGTVIFGVPEKSQSFILKLFNGLGETVSNIVELKNVPVSAG